MSVMIGYVNKGESALKRATIVTFLSAPDHSDLTQTLQKWIYPQKNEISQRKRSKLARMHLECTLFPEERAKYSRPGMVATVMIHWAYHDRLLPGVCDAISSLQDNNL